VNRRAMVVALILSLFVSVVLWKKLQTTPRGYVPPAVAAPKQETKALLVAKKRVPGRMRLEKETMDQYFEIRDILASDAERFPDAFVSVASLPGRFAAMTILPGDIITPQRLLEKDSFFNVAQAIPAGKRAFSITVSKESGVGGFIEQGDYVDVVASFKPRDSEPIAKIVLQDILVLAVGGLYQFDSGVASTVPAIAAGKVDLITLAVTPDELEHLMYLVSGVTFRLVLKNPKDKDVKIVTAGAAEKQVMTGMGTVPQIPTEPPPPVKPTLPIVPEELPQIPPPPVQPPTSFELPPAVQDKGPLVSEKPQDDGKVLVRFGEFKLNMENGGGVLVSREGEAQQIVASSSSEKATQIPAPRSSLQAVNPDDEE